MPRPPQQVPPDTLGGRIRAERKKHNYSLERVAGKYSTSLLSQIERNRVDPSQESLRYFAEQLDLPFDELMMLAQRQRTSGHGETQYKHYEAIRIKVAQAVENKQHYEALDQLREVDLALVQLPLRWRLASLRGQCFFQLRQFSEAEQDFRMAVNDLPEIIADEFKPEVMMLHLRYAAALKMVEQPLQALRQFELANALMDGNTPARLIVDSLWDMSIIYYDQASQNKCRQQKQEQLHTALSLAEDARVLSRRINQRQQADLLTCHIGLVEQAMGRLDEARLHLRTLLEENEPLLEQLQRKPGIGKKEIQAQANVCSATAWALAGVELEAGNFNEALLYARKASDTGNLTYIVRRAEAHMMRGQILDKMDAGEHEAEQAFRDAIEVLHDTNRIDQEVKAYDLLGRYLLKHGKIDAGNEALDMVRRLTHSSPASSTLIPTEGDQNDANRDN